MMVMEISCSSILGLTRSFCVPLFVMGNRHRADFTFLRVTNTLMAIASGFSTVPLIGVKSLQIFILPYAALVVPTKSLNVGGAGS